MSLGGPNIYPGVLSWLGMARELTAGTPLVPVVTQPLNQAEYEPEDMPHFLDDKAIRGSMTDLFYKTLGVEQGTFSFGAPNFLDTQGYWFDNVFGDVTTGSIQANPATVSGGIPVGATSCTLAAAPPSSYTAGATIQIGAGATAEVVIIGSTSASSVVTFAIAAGGEAYPMRFTHATGTTVQTCGTPFTHKFAALNSPLGYGGAYGAQPPTHTFTDITNIVNTFTSSTYGTVPHQHLRGPAVPERRDQEPRLQGNAEQLLGVKCPATRGCPSVAGTAVTNVTTNSRPIPNWNSTVVLAGNTISTSATLTLASGNLLQSAQAAVAGLLDRRRARRPPTSFPGARSRPTVRWTSTRLTAKCLWI